MGSYIYNLATDKYNGPGTSLIKFVLFILSLIYGSVIRLLMFFYSMKPFQPACKVISAGNITLGGTGKTPLVIYLVRRLKARGHKLAVISRGYLNSDEPQMLEEDLKDVAVIVDADRGRGIKRAISEYGVDTVILDDGFQQWRIKKDLDIVAIDTLNPFGNKQMIPRGILRQPLSALKTAHVFLLTRTDRNPKLSCLEDFLNRINPGAIIAGSVHSPAGFYELGKKGTLLNVSLLEGKTVASVCGIADPGSFAHSLKSLGMTIGLAFEFSDHHDYSLKDLEAIINSAKQKGIDAIVTTEKDAVKLCKLQIAETKLRIFVLRIELKITKNEERFLERLSGVYAI